MIFGVSRGKSAKLQLGNDSCKGTDMTLVDHTALARKKRFLMLQTIVTFIGF